MFMHILSK